MKCKSYNILTLCVAISLAIVILFASGALATKIVAYDAAGSLVGQKEAIKAFTAKTGIEVEILASPWTEWEEKVPLMLATGEQLDVIRFDHVRLAKAVRDGWLISLMPYIQRDKIDLTMFPKAALWYPPFDKIGELYTLPYNVALTVTWYNRAQLQESGVAFPSSKYGHQDTYYDNFVGMVKKLVRTDLDGRVTRWGTQVTGDGSQLIMAFSQADWVSEKVDRFRGTDPDVVEALTKITNLWLKEGVTGLRTGGGGGSLPDGTLATLVRQTGSWYTSLDPKNIDIGIAPMFWGGKGPGVNGGINSWGISSTSKNREAAWEFVKYFTCDDGVIGWMDNVSLSPPVHKKYARPWMERMAANMPNANLDTVMQAAEFLFIPRGTLSTAWGECSKLLGTATKAVSRGEKSVMQAMSEIKDQIDTMLKANPVYK